MQIFGIFIHWQKKTPASTTYPTHEELQAMPADAPQLLRDWRDCVNKLAAKVYGSECYLFYNRLNLDNGDVLTMTGYTSKASFDALRAANADDFDMMELIRDAVAEEYGLEVIVKEGEFAMDAVDYSDSAAVQAFMTQSLA